MFVGYLHSATLDESQMSRMLQPELSALSSSMLDIREVLARCAKDEQEELSRENERVTASKVAQNNPPDEDDN
ncbi:hypothetical protein C9426_12425 [Serratia sp. S1B]|nr:hypothetical protein C9426_12425 [Serratia sp. S1B]